MSYCWRYGCLPPAFARNPFNATLTTDRFNIQRMPGSTVWNTTIKATQGVVISVCGPPLVAGQQPVAFSGTSAGDDRLNFNVTTPAGG